MSYRELQIQYVFLMIQLRFILTVNLNSGMTIFPIKVPYMLAKNIGFTMDHLMLIESYMLVIH